MAGKIAVYNLGQLGVDIVRSPVHLDDGAFTLLQNAQIDSVKGVGGIRRRDGTDKLNAAPLAGAVRGLIGLPLPDQNALNRWFYIGIDDRGGVATGAWRRSSDGAAWATVAVGGVIQVPASLAQVAFTGKDDMEETPWCVLNNKLYYPGNDYVSEAISPGAGTNPTIHCFDGTTDSVICAIPPNPFYAAQASPFIVMSMIAFSGTQIALSTSDGSSGDRARVLLLDVTTGSLTHLGPDTDIVTAGTSMPLLLCSHLGRIWYGSWNTSGGTASRTFWVRPGDRTWTRDPNGDAPNTGNGYCVGIASFLGDLYLGFAGDVGTNSLLRKRTTATGAWSTVKTNGSVIFGNAYKSLTVSSDRTKMFFFENTASGAGNTAGQQTIFSTVDGAAFTNEYDVGVNLGNLYVRPGAPCWDSNGDLYWPFLTTSSVCQILKRTAGGAWSIADNAGKPLRGPLVRLSF